MKAAELDLTTLQQRYDLLCRALQAIPAADDPQPVLDTVSRLDDLIHRELLELARLGSPDDFADIYLGFTRELARFREFCADPRLAEKTVVAFGGPFSAGKSSLINALIGKKLLVVEVDPTTALPAYVMAGEADTVHALNLHRLRVSLTENELASLTHDETHRYGSQVARALSAAFITRREFPWSNLAFVDTPGYTGRATAGDRNDAEVAAAQLAGAHAIVWIVSIKQGNLTEEDLTFLARIDPDIPRIVVASHADQVSEEDRAAVIERMAETLAARNLSATGVYPVSARPRQAELLAPLRAQLDAWNQTPRQQRFAHRFKALFTRYQRGLEREADATRWQLHRINRMVALAEGDLGRDAADLKTVMDERLRALKTVEIRLHELRNRFFSELKRTGDMVGIPLAEPHEIEMQEGGRNNLLEQIVALREQDGHKRPDMRSALSVLCDIDIATYQRIVLKRPHSPRSRTPLELMQSQQSNLTNLRDSKPGSAKGDDFGNKPLKEHFIATHSEHIRYHYALLLAAVLSNQPVVSEKQSRLFRQLLDSILLGDIRGALFEQVRNLRSEQLFEAVCLIREAGLTHNIIIDVLVLLRLDGKIGEEAAHLVEELATVLNVDKSQLAMRAEDASEIIDMIARKFVNKNLDAESRGGNGEAEGFDSEGIFLAEFWPSQIRNIINYDALRRGLQGGVWVLERSLFISTSWWATGAIVIFRNGATIHTELGSFESKSSKVEISNCYLVDAVLYFGGGQVKIGSCDWIGDYDKNAKRTALVSDKSHLSVIDCNFFTRNARTISSSDGKLDLTGSQFVLCGHAELRGGAVAFHDDSSRRQESQIKKSKFDRCIASHGGGLYFDWPFIKILECEFSACQSLGLKSNKGGDIAVFAKRSVREFMLDCTFHQTSISIGDGGWGGFGNPALKSTVFYGGSLYYYDNYDRYGKPIKVTSGCRFFFGGGEVEAKIQ